MNLWQKVTSPIADYFSHRRSKNLQKLWNDLDEGQRRAFRYLGMSPDRAGDRYAEESAQGKSLRYEREFDRK